MAKKAHQISFSHNMYLESLAENWPLLLSSVLVEPELAAPRRPGRLRRGPIMPQIHAVQQKLISIQ